MSPNNEENILNEKVPQENSAGPIPVPKNTELLEKIGPSGEQSDLVKSLRTYQGDIAEAIKKQNASFLTFALAEKKRADGQTKPAPTEHAETKKGVGLLILSIFLIILGAGAIATFYYLRLDNTTLLAPDSQTKTLVPYDSKFTERVSLITKDQTVKLISDMKGRWRGQTKEIFFIELLKKTNADGEDKSLEAPEFFSSLKTRIPDSLLRSFGKEFMLGLMMTERGPQTFIFVNISSFERAFPGMLFWEKTIYDDIGILFSNKIIPVTETAVGTTTQATTTKIINFESEAEDAFEDLTLKNRDARILRNDRGEIILLYSFLNARSLLITENSSVFEDMVEKINAR